MTVQTTARTTAPTAAPARMPGTIVVLEQGDFDAAPVPVDPGRRAIAPLLALLALSPLPFASNRPWSWSLLALAAGLVLMAWAWSVLRSGRPMPVAPGRIAVPAALYCLVCAYAAVQTIPGMPGPLANPFWRLLDEIGLPARDSISIAPAATLAALMRLLCYGAVFFLFLQVGRDGRRAHRCFAWIAGISAAYSTYGLVVEFGDFGKILWFDKWAYRDSLTSTFVNRNSFATFAGIGLLAALALLARQVLRGSEPVSLTRIGLANLIAKLDGPAAFASICLLLDLVALLLTQSRAGTAATLAGAVVFLAGLGLAAGRRSRVSFAFSGIVLGVVACYFMLGGDGVLARASGLASELVDGDADGEIRFHAYADILRAIEGFGLYGIGYGGFEDFFKAYRSPSVLVYFDKAHSTWLENALELGVPAAAALAAAIGAIALRCVLALRRRSSAFVFGWAAAAATVLVGLHATVDFSLQMPAVAVTYAAMLGIGCAQSWSRRVATDRAGRVFRGRRNAPFGR